jgi:hypothetical protein
MGAPGETNDVGQDRDIERERGREIETETDSAKAKAKETEQELDGSAQITHRGAPEEKQRVGGHLVGRRQT